MTTVRFHSIFQCIWPLALWWVLLVLPLQAADIAQEKVLFDAAIRSFEDGFYEEAQKKFESFIKVYPISDRLILVTQLSLHSRAEVFLARGQYKEASAVFSQIAREFPRSPRYMDAVLGQAYAELLMDRADQTVALLSIPEAPFGAYAHANPSDPKVIRGYLLLAEAYRDLQQPQQVLDVLERLNLTDLDSQNQWKSLFLKVQALQSLGEVRQAVALSTNLVAQAEGNNSLLMKADSAMLQAEIFEKMKDYNSARNVLHQNISTNMPPAKQRLALMRISDLWLKENKYEQAADSLSTFLEKAPQGPLADFALFTLGESRLNQFYYLKDSGAPVAPMEEILTKVRTSFLKVIEGFPDSTYLGKVHLGTGWAWWEAGMLAQDGGDRKSKIESAHTHFAKAATLLPISVDQALARFKVADCLLRLENYKESVQILNTLIEEYNENAEVRRLLFDQANYQIIRCAVVLEDIATAGEAMARLISEAHNPFFNERGRLVLGHGLNKLDMAPVDTRAIFESFIAQFPQSALLPEARLGLGRTYERESDWENARQVYSSWLKEYHAHPAHPYVEYYHIYSLSRSGKDEEAKNLFTDFVQRNKKHELAPLAQNWIADYFHSKGDIIAAEENYQRVIQEWPNAPISFQATLMAGRCAFLRQGYDQAQTYFTNLIKKLLGNESLPRQYLNEAYYSLGDVFAEMENHVSAINSFERISEEDATWYPRAKGRIGSIYLLLSAENPGQLEQAKKAFSSVINHASAPIHLRSLAEIGMGQVFEAENNPAQAIHHYLRVFYGENRRADESASAYTVQQAGAAAVNLLEIQGRKKELTQLMTRMQEWFPLNRERLNRRMSLLNQENL